MHPYNNYTNNRYPYMYDYSNDTARGAPPRATYTSATIVDKHGQRWVENISDMGTYYVNEVTGVTTYDYPEIDTFKEASIVDDKKALNNIASGMMYTEEPIPNSLWVKRIFSTGEISYYNTETYESTWEWRVVEQSLAPKAIDAEPIPDSDWFLVKSDDNQIFYFHGPKKISLWERPDELKDNKHLASVYEKFSGVPQKRPLSPVIEPPKEFAMKKSKWDAPSVGRDDSDFDQEVKQAGDQIEAVPRRLVSITELNFQSDLTHEGSAVSEETKKMLTLALEERVGLFRQMLEEFNVSAFSTWEKESERMKEDPRMRILATKERKHHFNEFLKNRVAVESAQTRKLREEKKEKFFEFLETVVKDPRMKYLEFSSKYASSPAFNIFSRTKEREAFFNEYMDTFVKSTICIDPKQIKKNYWKMLEELNLDVDASDWRSTKSALKTDLRYINVDSSKQRKGWFKEFLKELKESKKLENKSKEEIALLSLKQREEDIQREREEIKKSREKTLNHFELKHSIDKLNVLLNHHIQTSLFSYETICKILKEKSSKSEGIFQTLKEPVIRRTIDEHIKKIESKQVQLFHYTLDELLDAGTIHLGMELSQVCDTILKARGITIDISENKLETIFNSYKKAKEKSLLDAFHELLAETRLIDLILGRKNIENILDSDIISEVSEFLRVSS